MHIFAVFAAVPNEFTVVFPPTSPPLPPSRAEPQGCTVRLAPGRPLVPGHLTPIVETGDGGLPPLPVAGSFLVDEFHDFFVFSVEVLPGCVALFPGR